MMDLKEAIIIVVSGEMENNACKKSSKDKERVLW